MSRKNQPKNKDLVNLEVKTAKDVWKKNKKGEFVLDSNLDFYGRVDKGTSSFITMTNKRGKNFRFVEDTCELTIKNKNEIIKMFNSGKNTVAYLVKKKNK